MDYKFLISIYAAITSTIVFIWRIYEFYYDRRGKFNIKMSRIQQMVFLTKFKNSSSVDLIVIKITNTSKNKRFINEPSFESNVKSKKYFNLLKFDKTINYPLPLEPGETHEYSLEANQLKDELKQFNILKIRTILKDSLNKKYYSSWFNI